jgi:methanogenic corrinoid protein MtbC1
MDAQQRDHRIESLKAALLSVDRSTARRVFLEGVNADGAVPFMENTVGVVMDRIGAAWEAGELALSQVYMAGRICEELSLSSLPEAHPERKNNPSIALGVFEDHHRLGKQMVHSVLRNEGFVVRDLDVIDLQEALKLLKSGTIEVFLLSCLMLSSALRIEKLCAAIKAEDLPVRIVVGGAPFRFDPELWREIGADAMGSTASQAPALVRTVSGGLM